MIHSVFILIISDSRWIINPLQPRSLRFQVWNLNTNQELGHLSKLWKVCRRCRLISWKIFWRCDFGWVPERASAHCVWEKFGQKNETEHWFLSMCKNKEHGQFAARLYLISKMIISQTYRHFLQSHQCFLCKDIPGVQIISPMRCLHQRFPWRLQSLRVQRWTLRKLVIFRAAVVNPAGVFSLRLFVARPFSF